MKLVRTNPLFAASEQVRSLKPFMEGNLAVLEDGSDRDAELLTAFAAGAQATPRCLALDLVNPRRIGIPTMRANGSLNGAGGWCFAPFCLAGVMDFAALNPILR